MDRRNVLITSAAAKTLLVEAFRKAASNHACKVYTADMDAVCAAAAFSDTHFVVPSIDAADALKAHLQLCEIHNIRLIVPTRDGELSFFAANKAAFLAQGTDILVPTSQTLDIVSNKHLFSNYVEARGLKAIPRLSRPIAADAYPVFIRPSVGAGSRGAHPVHSPKLLPDAPEHELLIHPLIDAPEYSADLLMTLDGRTAIGAIARERLQIVAGESKITRTVNLPKVEADICALGEALGLVGHNVVQFFDDPQRGHLFIEINPRFGGASNLGIQAGLDSPDRILAMAHGDMDSALYPVKKVRGLTLYRYSQDVFHQNGTFQK